MIATKAQLVEFILDNFQQDDGEEVSRSKIEGLKKAELEEFIRAKSSEEEFEAWMNK